jgi:glutathione synthase/RimK-type ligase-like ATP-grasp enzyme
MPTPLRDGAVPMTDLALVTASRMPKPDPESGLLVAALARLGVRATIHPWDQPCDWSQFPLVVSRTPWDYFHRVQEFLSWARGVAAVTELLNPLATIAWNAHKSYLLDLERAGVPIVPTVLVARSAGAGEQDAALARFREAVIKPAVAGGALGALRVGATTGSGVAANHLRTLLAEQDALVQPFMPGVQTAGETSLIFFDGQFSHGVRKIPAAGDFRVHQHYGGTLVAHTPSPSELAVAQAALAVAPAPAAYARIDMVPGASGPVVMEAELIEPELFLGSDPAAPGRYARCLAARLNRAVIPAYP